MLAVALFAFLYGVATRAFGWFPNGVLESAYNQARALSPFQPRLWTSVRVYEREGVREVQPARISPGLTMASGRWRESDWEPSVRLMDLAGRTLHERIFKPTELFGEPFKSVHGFQLLSGGEIVVNIAYAGTVRADACGNVLWKLDSGSHHSIIRDDDGSFWISANDPTPTSHPVWEIAGPGRVYHDKILHVSGDGRILQEIGILDVLAAAEQTIPYLIRHQEGSDITHLNDVEPLSDAMAPQYPLFDSGDLLVSVKHLNLIFVFDPASGAVKWHASEPFIQQHDPDFVGDGWIGVFDNHEDGTPRGERLGGSRIVLLQAHTDSIIEIFPTPLSEPFYTPTQGTWQKLTNGNLLLSESRAGRVVEVAPDGQTVWDWVIAPYDDSTLPEVYQSIRYNVTPDEVLGWPCSEGN